MIRRAALGLLLALAITPAARAQAPATIERMAPGNSMLLTGRTLDTYGGVYAPGANGLSGNYSVLFTLSSNPHNGTDDFSTLDCGAGNTGPVTYTLPAISSTVFPAGHGVGFINTSQTFLCTITATTSTISGAAGVTSGSPAAPGGPITLFPNGQVWLQSDGINYKARDFVPGVWYQGANNTTALQWTGLSGYPRLHLHCSGVLPVAAQDTILSQLAYNGVYQTANYSWSGLFNFVGNTTGAGVTADSNGGPSTAFKLTGALGSTSDFSSGVGATIDAWFDFSDGTGNGFRRSIMSYSSSVNGGVEQMFINFGAAPYNITTESVNQLQIFSGGSGSNLRSGSCWLEPRL